MAIKQISAYSSVTTPAVTDEFIVQQVGVTRKETLQQIHNGMTALTAKTTPVDADTMPLNDSAASNAAKKVTWANIKTAVGTGLGAVINTLATSKSTPVDADMVVLSDTESSYASAKVTWANIKATLKTYFDTLYIPTSGIAGQLADGTTYYKKKVTFTGWNMDTTISIDVAHGISSFTGAKVVGLYAYIYTAALGYYNLCFDGYGGINIVGATAITLARATGGGFDVADFNNCSGAVIIEYVA